MSTFKFFTFCVTLINFLPLIKRVPQFLIKGKLFLEMESGEVGITGRTSSVPNSAHRLSLNKDQSLRSGILTYASLVLHQNK